jgi:hypothetical protein
MNYLRKIKKMVNSLRKLKKFPIKSKYLNRVWLNVNVKLKKLKKPGLELKKK